MSNNLGTQKQAETLLRLAQRVNHHDAKDPELFISKVLTMRQERIREVFASLNAVTGFDRQTSKASDRQANLIQKLEKEFFGVMKSKPYEMTHADADARIKAVKGYIEDAQSFLAAPAAPVANVIDMAAYRKSA